VRRIAAPLLVVAAIVAAAAPAAAEAPSAAHDQSASAHQTRLNGGSRSVSTEGSSLVTMPASELGASSISGSGTASLIRLASVLDESLGRAGRRSASLVPMAEETFWAWDFTSDTYYEVAARLVHVSPLVWVYVEEGHTLRGRDVVSIATAYEDRIFPTLTSIFGPAPSPGIDGEDAVTLLLMDIRDPYSIGSSPFISGYFLPVNQYLQSDLDQQMPGHQSNEREMLYVDIEPTDPGGPVILQTVAHELQHLIHWNHDRSEDAWLNEGLSELAVFLAGLGHPRAHVEAYLDAPGGPLQAWSAEAADYGKVYLFFLYLWERAGDSRWLGRLVADPAHGMDSVAAHHPEGTALEKVYRDFALALALDGTANGPPQSLFRSITIGHAAADSFESPKVTFHGGLPVAVDGSLPPWSFRLDGFTAGPSGADIEMKLPSDSRVCGAAITRDFGTVASHLEGCGGDTGRPTTGVLSGGQVLTAIANASSDVVTISVRAADPARSQSPERRAFLPITLSQPFPRPAR
jgi:hypothetical protein